MRPYVNRFLPAISIMIVALLAGAVAAEAQNSLGIGRPEQAIRPEGPLAGLLFWIQEQQQAFYKLLTTELSGMRQDWTHIWMLAGLSFAYGVFHAAGPGHGKAVISSYMLANEKAAKRGIFLAFASAAVQAVTAIVLIALVFAVLRGIGIRQDAATRWLEIASYAGVTLLGAWLLWKKSGIRFSREPALVPAVSLSAAAVSHGAAHVHAHHHHRHAHESHDHGHDHGPHHHGHARHAHDGHHHHAHDAHRQGEDCGCGHSHMPDPSQLEGRDFTLRQAWVAIMAVGLRPCSGALIVLTFSFLYGLHAAGIVATFAMAAGTGLTVAILAAMAVWAKDMAIRVGGAAASGAAIHKAIEITAAGLVFFLGVTLLSAALYA